MIHCDDCKPAAKASRFDFELHMMVFHTSDWKRCYTKHPAYGDWSQPPQSHSEGGF